MTLPISTDQANALPNNDLFNCIRRCKNLLEGYPEALAECVKICGKLKEVSVDYNRFNEIDGMQGVEVNT